MSVYDRFKRVRRLALVGAISVAAGVLTLPADTVGAIPPWATCSNGAMRRSTNPIAWQWGTGMTGGTADEIEHRDGASIAIWNWVSTTFINSTAGGNLTWTRINSGVGGPNAEHFPISTIEIYGTCTLTVSEIRFNPHFTDAFTNVEISGTAAHEFGHRTGFLHDPNETGVCTPDTIMLRFRVQRWNGTCTWAEPRSIDRWIINATY